MFPNVCLLILMLAAVGGQIVGNELTMRSFDSVDIQVCADSILATEQVSLRDAIVTRLRELLSSAAVYFTRTYTTASTGTVCYMFVFQARNPEEVRESVQLVMTDTGTLPVTFQGLNLVCRIMAVPWVGQDTGPLGLSWQFSANDVLLWGAITGGALASCSIAVCCFVQLSTNKERKRAADLLAKDSALLAEHIKKKNQTTVDIKKNKKPATSTKKNKKKKAEADEEENDEAV